MFSHRMERTVEPLAAGTLSESPRTAMAGSGRLEAWLSVALLTAWVSLPLMAAEAPPLPPSLPPLPAAPPITVQPTGEFKPIPRPLGLPTNTVPVNTALMPQGMLVPDAEIKDYNQKLGETNATFNFHFDNKWTNTITVNAVKTTCGCTTARLPAMPWIVPPAGKGDITVVVDTRGKSGSVTKGITLETDQGRKVVLVRVNIPTEVNAPSGANPVLGGGPVAATGATMDRARNISLAAVDPQNVFRGDCAQCHSTPAAGKKGSELYTAICGICHDSPHRATMVPDLQALTHPIDRDFWITWITNGKPGTLMPAFSSSRGGPLTDDQILSIADFLTATIRPVEAKPAGKTTTTPGQSTLPK